jgi:hypothetical protein
MLFSKKLYDLQYYQIHLINMAKQIDVSIIYSLKKLTSIAFLNAFKKIKLKA